MRSISVAPVHGGGEHWSIECFQLTTIGATYFAEERVPVCAFAEALTVTELIPKIVEKIPGAGFEPLTEIVSFGMVVVENETLLLPMPPPFLFAYPTASALACAVSSGSACAPARAAASASAWSARFAWNQAPTSRTAAAMPRRTVRKRIVRTVA